MQRSYVIIAVVVCIIVLVVAAYWILSQEKTHLSPAEARALIEMRQEEKLARDVYLALYSKWGIRAFSNIARSEQTHTNMVKTLLERYGVPDPVASDLQGVYKDPKFEQLYKELVSLGSTSEVNALIVGATVEDLDIKDLEEWLSTVHNKDIRDVFCSLIRGSENHLRAFTSLLEHYGVHYRPKYITDAEYNKILSGGTVTTKYCG